MKIFKRKERKDFFVVISVKARIWYFTLRSLCSLRLIILFLLFTASAHAAVEPSERMDSPILEQQAEDIYGKIRCVVCQSESIADSGAAVAKDMRAMIRERLKAGGSEEQIVAWLHERYGDAALMTPPVKPATWLLWIGPFLVLMLGGAGVWRLFRKGAA